MIVPNCRQRITGQDLAFALDVMARKGLRAPVDDRSSRHRAGSNRPEEPASLPSDLDLDALLDSQELFEALLRTRELLSVSPYFFYYVLVRQVFLERGIGERPVADYVGALLSHFLEGKRLRSEGTDGRRAFVYLVDLVQGAREASDPGTAFALAAHMGDVALFLTGIFPDAIYHRQTYGRRLPGLEYYEALGRSGYRSAAQHPPPRHRELAELLDYMASEFRIVRQALNDLSDSYFCMSRGEGETVDRLLRRALYGRGGDLETESLRDREDDV
jgi:hypothetical protein